MENNLTIQEIKNISVEILDYIVSVCEKNRIQYFLAYGTLLGAVRHKGFIPWDDDIDIVLLRPEYDRLLQCLLKENNKRYKLLKPGDPNFVPAFSMVMDQKTEVLNEGEITIKDGRGIKIDIFPLDGFASSKSIRPFILDILYKGICFTSFNRIPQKERLGNLLYLPWKICNLLGNAFFQKGIKLFLRKDFTKSKYVAHIDLITTLFPIDIFKSCKKMEFEGKFYNVPIGYKEYLTIAYGDYMQLPPENERRTHNINAIRLDK